MTSSRDWIFLCTRSLATICRPESDFPVLDEAKFRVIDIVFYRLTGDVYLLSVVEASRQMGQSWSVMREAPQEKTCLKNMMRS
jgi:hypothetical protein